MIEISCKRNQIIVKGHAGYAPQGKDIVCAAVSILVATFANMYDVNIIEDEPGFIDMEWDRKADTRFLIKGLSLLADTYPEYVRVKK